MDNKRQVHEPGKPLRDIDHHSLRVLPVRKVILGNQRFEFDKRDDSGGVVEIVIKNGDMLMFPGNKGIRERRTSRPIVVYTSELDATNE